MIYADAPAQYPVVFGFEKAITGSERFEGQFLGNDQGWDNIAVTPAVRERVAKFVSERSSESPEFRAAAAERIRNLPFRDDGLIYLDQCTTTVISRLGRHDR